jgi:hypothetical protein
VVGSLILELSVVGDPCFVRKTQTEILQPRAHILRCGNDERNSVRSFSSLFIPGVELGQQNGVFD